VPFLAIAFSFLCGMIVFLPFPGWQQLVGFISSATVLAYATAPLSFGALRREVPHHQRPFRLPGGALVAPAAFMVANELILFSGWTVVWKLLVAVLIGAVLLGISFATSPPERRPQIEWRAGIWLLPYLVGLGVVSYLSSFGGPANALPFGWDVLVMAVFGLVVYLVAVRMRLPRAAIEQHIGEFTAEAEAEEAAVALP
jgi:amino acid transporter